MSEVKVASAEEGVEAQLRNRDEDHAWLTGIFPPEIWRMIFEAAKDPQILNNMAKASGFFKEGLEPLRKMYLFEKVFPLLSQYLTWQEVTDCRKVCHLWRQGTDHFLQNTSKLDPIVLTSEGCWVDNPPESSSCDQLHNRKQLMMYSDPLSDGAPLYEFTTSEDIQDFMARFRGHSGSPFISRSVVIRLDQYRTMVTDVVDLLTVFGKEIWSLQLASDDAVLTAFTLLVLMKRILNLTPNLRSLSVLIAEITAWYGDEDKIKTSVWRKLRRSFLRRPLPPLPHLRRLEYDGYKADGLESLGKFPSCYFAELDTMDGYCYWLGSETINKFSNLTSARIHLTAPECLENVAGLQAPIKTLSVRIEFPFPEIGLLAIFWHIRQLKDTLLDLSIVCCMEEPGNTLQVAPSSRKYRQHLKQVDRDQWSFPKLKIVTLRFLEDQSLNDLLLIAGTFPKFLLKVTGRLGEESPMSYYNFSPNDRLQIHGYIEDMYQSAIWERMASLQTLVVSGTRSREGFELKNIYTRRELEEFLEEE